MTTITIKRKAGRVIVTKENYTRGRMGSNPPAPRGPKPSPPPNPPQVHNVQGRSKRVHEIKRIDERKVSPEQRVKRLVQLAHELGPEKLTDEIAVHQRKIADLEAALMQYNKELQP